MPMPGRDGGMGWLRALSSFHFVLSHSYRTERAFDPVFVASVVNPRGTTSYGVE